MSDYGPGVEAYADWIERPTGILTQKDRQWLFEEKEGNDMYSTGQGRRKRRSDAATRLRNGMVDFSVLMRADIKQREELMERIGFGDDIDVALGEGIKDCIAWIYEGIERQQNIDFETIVKDGVNKAYDRKNIVKDEDGKIQVQYVDSVDIEWQTPQDPHAMAEALLRGEELDDEDLGALVRMQFGTDWVREHLEDADTPAWTPPGMINEDDKDA